MGNLHLPTTHLLDSCFWGLEDPKSSHDFGKDIFRGIIRSTASCLTIFVDENGKTPRTPLLA